MADLKEGIDIFLRNLVLFLVKEIVMFKEVNDALQLSAFWDIMVLI